MTSSTHIFCHSCQRTSPYGRTQLIAICIHCGNEFVETVTTTSSLGDDDHNARDPVPVIPVGDLLSRIYARTESVRHETVHRRQESRRRLELEPSVAELGARRVEERNSSRRQRRRNSTRAADRDRVQNLGGLQNSAQEQYTRRVPRNTRRVQLHYYSAADTRDASGVLTAEHSRSMLPWLIVTNVQGNGGRTRINNDRTAVYQGSSSDRCPFSGQLNELKTEKLSCGSSPEIIGEPCAVCCEDYQTGDTVVYFPCGHVFHTGCAQPWLLNKDTCPLCRMPVYVNQPH